MVMLTASTRDTPPTSRPRVSIGFPDDLELRKITIEMLAEGDETIDDLMNDNSIIDEAVRRAREVIRRRAASEG